MMPDLAYSRIDRLLHHVAFRALWVQQALGDLENRLFAHRLSSTEIVRPVFITSLPRAGTTLLLELLNSLAEFSTQSYRDMPFLLCPLIWDRVSRNFRIAGHSTERAHGDDVTIDFDSPEAFEEVLWRMFWPDKYHETHIDVWASGDLNAEFEAFFRHHVRKVITLRRLAPPGRYLSKNNANIARLDMLLQLFPDATILIPFRHPIEQASSLLRQHLHFLERHASDHFAARYMEWLGHYEFGAALRPLNFGSWTQLHPSLDARTLEFWVTYWVKAYATLAQHPSVNICFLDFDDMCREPERALTGLAKVLRIEAAQLMELAPRIRTPQSRRNMWEPSDARTAEALDVLELLKSRSID
jgi:Sulfotransferase family